MAFSRSNVIRWSFLLFIFSLPLGTKKFLFSFLTPFSNFYTSEYTSAFLYGSDLLLLAFLCLLIFLKPFSWYREYFYKFKKPFLFLTLFLILSLISIFPANYVFFAAYSFLRLLLTVVAALAIGMVLHLNIVKFKEIAVVLSLAAVFESVLGFLQFILQKSIGLWFLGETVFGPGTPGIAGISVNGLNFARAYGTMPHANILGGFLVLGLLALAYLFLKEERFTLRIFEAGGIFIVLTGLLLTFSRSGWIVAGVSVFFLLVWEFLVNRGNRRRIVYLVSLLLVISSLLFVILGWAIFSRAHLSTDEGPVRDRWSYDQMGAELIISHPFGVGIGNELFYAYHNGFFEKYGVNSWGQWQPIHNLYLMIGSETGILGLLSFLFLIGSILISNFKFQILNQFQISKLENIIPIIMLASLLLFGLFDHFLWDLQLGRLMFWVIIGIVLGASTLKSSKK